MVRAVLAAGVYPVATISFSGGQIRTTIGTVTLPVDTEMRGFAISPVWGTVIAELWCIDESVTPPRILRATNVPHANGAGSAPYWVEP